MSEELLALGEVLYAQMKAVGIVNATLLVYSSASHPYFFKDNNSNGVLDPEEATSSNSFKGWTAPLMKAAFNFQYYQKEHGAWAHNSAYMAQLLIDSIEDLGGDVTSFERP